MHKPTNGRTVVTLDAEFLARVYRGDDPQGFAQFVGQAAASPDFLVMAAQPAALGIIELRESNYELGKVAYGHCLSGDWDILRIGIKAAQLAGCRNFLYPIAHDQPNRPQLEKVLTKRLHFEPWQHLYVRRIDLDGPHNLNGTPP